MGVVALTLEATPKGDCDIEKTKNDIKESLKDFGEIKQINEISIGFGLKKLEILITFDERPGGTDNIREAVENLEGIENVEEKDITLL